MDDHKHLLVPVLIHFWGQIHDTVVVNNNLCEIQENIKNYDVG